MSEPESAYDLSEVAKITARHEDHCKRCPTRGAVDGYQADLRRASIREHELVEALQGVVEACAAARKLLAKYEKEST